MVLVPAAATADANEPRPTFEAQSQRRGTPRPKLRTHPAVIPELDPSAAGAAGLLLLGGALAIRGRRRVNDGLGAGGAREGLRG